MPDYMVNESFHNAEVVDAYIIELRIFAALKDHSRYLCGKDSAEDTVSHFGVAEGVGHEQSSVKLSVIDEVVYTALTHVEGGAAYHSAKTRNIGDIHIVCVCECVYAFEYVVLIFFVKTGYYNNDLFGSFTFHTDYPLFSSKLVY